MGAFLLVLMGCAACWSLWALVVALLDRERLRRAEARLSALEHRIGMYGPIVPPDLFRELGR